MLKGRKDQTHHGPGAWITAIHQMTWSLCKGETRRQTVILPFHPGGQDAAAGVPVRGCLSRQAPAAIRIPSFPPFSPSRLFLASALALLLQRFNLMSRLTRRRYFSACCSFVCAPLLQLSSRMSPVYCVCECTCVGDAGLLAGSTYASTEAGAHAGPAHTRCDVTLTSLPPNNFAVVVSCRTVSTPQTTHLRKTGLSLSSD